MHDTRYLNVVSISKEKIIRTQNPVVISGILLKAPRKMEVELS